ncbi:MAG: YkoF family thiamine/hydroxymethylpyrimidine-binding protein [Pseudomonadota bacterium]
MDIGVEISLYPLHEDYIPPIKAFIDRLNADAAARSGAVRVVTNSMSTQVFGDYDTVFALLQREMQPTFAHEEAMNGKAIFVMKFLGPMPAAGA